jgi:hypothetical protein
VRLTGFLPQVSYVQRIPFPVPPIATEPLTLRCPASAPTEWKRHVAAAARALAIFVYCYGAILAPTFHQAFHHPDHIHLGESIVELPHQDVEHHAGPAESEHDRDHHDGDPHDDDHDRGDHDRHDRHDADRDSPQPRDDEHGAQSLWHFGAALANDSDRVPSVTADLVLVPIGTTPRAERPRAARTRTPRLRGPPSVSLAHV